MDKHKITISFSKEYSDLYEYLKSKKDRSNLICGLLQNCINDESLNKEADLKQIVKDAITEALSSYDFSAVRTDKSDGGMTISDDESNDEISQEEKDIITGVFF